MKKLSEYIWEVYFENIEDVDFCFKMVSLGPDGLRIIIMQSWSPSLRSKEEAMKDFYEFAEANEIKNFRITE